MTKLLNKLHRFLFCLLILLLPVQLGKHFWPDWALVEGIRIDYLAPTVYLTDLLVIGILASWALSLWFKTKNQKPKTPAKGWSASGGKNTNKKLKYSLIIFCFLLVNILFAQNKQAAFLKFLKIIELFLLAVYVKKNVTIKPRKILAPFGSRDKQFNNLIILLFITVIYSSVVAWVQFLCQSSIGSFLWWLGERTFVSSTLGIARVVFNGRLFLRPYATFSHPNVLGGYLAVILPIIIFNQQSTINNQQLRSRNILKILAIFLGISTLFITFSRAAWVVGGMGIVTSFFLSKSFLKKKRPWPHGHMATWLVLLIVLVFLCSCVFMFFGRERLGQLRFNSESLQLRQELNSVALAMIKKHPLTGVGLNNFIPSLPNFKKGLSFKELQPVHNIYLLIAAETGLIGLGVFLWLIWLCYKKLLYGDVAIWLKKKKDLTIQPFNHLTIALTTILLLGLFDHYFFTLQQTQFLLAIVLGMVFGVRLD